MSAWFRQTLGTLDESVFPIALAALQHASARSGYASTFATQTEAWDRELRDLNQMKARLLGSGGSYAEWTLLLEYVIPRLGRRIDAVLLADDVVFVIEFKVGARTFKREDERQTEEYALDLHDFHVGSRDHVLV